MPARNTRAPARRPVARQHTVRPLAPVPDLETAAPSADAAAPAAARPAASKRVPAGQPGEGPAQRRGAGRDARSPRRTFVVLVALLVIALAGLAWSGKRWYDGDRLSQAQQAALAAAKQTTVDFVSISAASVDRDLQRIAGAATGDFKDEFTRGMPQVRQAVVENKVQSTGTVLRAGLVSGDLDSAVVLVAIDASVKNVGAPDGRLSHYRIQVDVALDPDSGRWLVSRLQFVG